MRTIPGTKLSVFPLCLGANVFGGRSDEQETFAVLDAYFEAGGNFIDTADVYTKGRSEQLIGRWVAERGNRDELVIATKVGMKDGLDKLTAATIARGAEESLQRLGLEHIDLFYAHVDDLETPQEETLRAFSELIDAGKVRAIAASNFEAERLASALEISRANGLPSYVGLQPEYSLVEREFESDGQRELCERENLAVFPYFSLAQGFLTGKHRPEGSDESSKRIEGARAYLEDERGPKVLEALDSVAAAHESSATAVAIAWLLAQPTVFAPVASARVPEQIPDLIAGTELELSADEVALLSDAGA